MEMKTVGELIKELERFDPDTKIMVATDNWTPDAVVVAVQPIKIVAQEMVSYHPDIEEFMFVTPYCDAENDPEQVLIIGGYERLW